MDVKKEIEKFFKGDVADDESTLAAYSRDAGFLYVKPKLVVFPKDAEDIGRLVSFVSEAKKENPGLSLTARAAGTDMSGGPINGSMIVEFGRYFNRIKEIGGDYAVCEPGVYYRDLEKETLEKGLFFPSYPASKEICAVGGMVANDAGGETSLAYGKTRRHVLRIKAVLRDGKEYVFEKIGRAELGKKIAEPTLEGEIYKKVFGIVEKNYGEIKAAAPKVSKNSAGYDIFEIWDGENFDMAKLLTGSQGTLCLFTEIKLGLAPVLKHSEMLVIFLNDLKPLPEIVNEVLKLKPESFEAYDDNTMRLAVDFMPEIVKGIDLSGGIPKLTLLAKFSGNDEKDVDNRLEAAYRKLSPLGVKMHAAKTPEEAEKYILVREKSFGLLKKRAQKGQTAPFIDDLIVRPEYLPEFLPKLYAILAKYPSFIFTVAGHVGDGNFHIIPLMHLDDPAQKAIIPALMEEVFGLVFKYGGSMTAEHNDGLIRSPYLKEMFGSEIYSIFEKIKDIFDPQDIFNPGKKVRADLRYALDHIKGKTK